jgi:hypothetical protein
MHSGIALEHAIEDLIAVWSRHLHIRQDQAAAPCANQLYGFFRIRRGDRFIANVGDDARDRFELLRIRV